VRATFVRSSLSCDRETLSAGVPTSTRASADRRTIPTSNDSRGDFDPPRSGGEKPPIYQPFAGEPKVAISR